MPTKTPRYCTICGTLHPTARLARACHNTGRVGRPPRPAYCNACGTLHPSVRAAQHCERTHRATTASASTTNTNALLAQLDALLENTPRAEIFLDNTPEQEQN